MNNSIILSIIFRATLSALNFIILLSTAAYFGPAIRGEISLLISNLAIIQLATDIINGPSVIFISKNKSLSGYLKISLLWTLLSSLILISILTLLNFSEPQYFFILLGLSLLLSINTFLLQIILSYKKIYPYFIIQIIQISIQLVLIFLLIYFKKIAFIYFCLSMLLPLAGALIAVVYYAFKYSKELNPSKIDIDYKDIIKTGLAAQTSSLFNFISTRIGFYFLASNKEELGIFSVAVTICESVWIITYGFASILYPEISTSNDENKNVKLTLNYLTYTLGLTSIALIFLLLLPSELFVKILGEKYSTINGYFIYLVPGIFIFSGGKLLWNYFAGKGLFYVNNIAWGIGSVVSIILTYFLLKYYNVVGLAASMTISYATITLTMIIFFFSRDRFILKK